MATFPPPQPQQVSEVHLSRFAFGVRRVLNDFRLLAMAILIGIAAIFSHGALLMIEQGRFTTVVLYVPIIGGICWCVQRLAHLRP